MNNNDSQNIQKMTSIVGDKDPEAWGSSRVEWDGLVRISYKPPHTL